MFDLLLSSSLPEFQKYWVVHTLSTV